MNALVLYLAAVLALSVAQPLGSAPDVRVTTGMASAPLAGTLDVLTSEDATLLTSAGKRQVPLADVETIEFTKSGSTFSAKAAACRVSLTDENVLSGESISSSGSDFELSGAMNAKIPPAAIAAVQIGNLSEEADRQWQEITSAALTSDIVVLRRGEDKLERVEGIILEVAEDSLKFEFSGTAIDIPVGRIAGFRLYSPPKELAPTTAKLQLGDEQLAVSSIGFASKSNYFTVSLPCGVEFDAASNMVKKIDYRIGRSLPLAEVAATFTGSPAPLGLATKIDSDLLPRWETRRDVDTQAPIQCLVFRGGGTAVLRLPSGFVNLTGNLRLEQSRRAVSVTVSIKLDSQVVFRKQFAPGDPESPLELPIAPDQRLEIEIAATGPTATGATVILSNPLLQK